MGMDNRIIGVDFFFLHQNPTWIKKKWIWGKEITNSASNLMVNESHKLW